VVVVHAGSVWELPNVVAYYQTSHATWVALATGSVVDDGQYTFPLVICPNTHILMLKCMPMILENAVDRFKPAVNPDVS